MAMETSDIRAGIRDCLGDVLLMQAGRLESLIASARHGKPVSNDVRRRRLQVAARQSASGKAQRTPAVLPLFGIIAHRRSWIIDLFGGTSTRDFQSQFDAALRNDAVSEIIIPIDSPGGGVFGVPELAQHIFESRGRKPIRSIADPLAASAALWIGTAADTFDVTPSGEAGSLGVFALHEDWSGALQQAGIDPTYIYAGKYKVEGNFDEPLTAEARDEIQRQVDATYEKFVAAVAKHRGVSASTARTRFGEGRMLNAEQSVKVGLADHVATFEQVVNGTAGKAKMSVAMRRRRLRLLGP